MSAQTENQQWLICVVALVSKNPREYGNYYVAVQGDRSAAETVQQKIAKYGFVAEDHRFFPDEIESLNIKNRSEEGSE